MPVRAYGRIDVYARPVPLTPCSLGLEAQRELLMMLAFLVDQTQQLCCALFRAVWAKLGSKRLLWERMRALFYDYRLESMRELLEALFYGLEKSHPILRINTS